MQRSMFTTLDFPTTTTSLPNNLLTYTMHAYSVHTPVLTDRMPMSYF